MCICVCVYVLRNSLTGAAAKSIEARCKLSSLLFAPRVLSCSSAAGNIGRRREPKPKEKKAREPKIINHIEAHNCKPTSIVIYRHLHKRSLQNRCDEELDGKCRKKKERKRKRKNRNRMNSARSDSM